MLSILIVDDETYVCDGITQNIPWHELGISPFSIHCANAGTKAKFRFILSPRQW